MIAAKFRMGEGSEAAHWYLPGEYPQCAYEILGVNGQWRSTNVGDARKYGLVPSVTTILRCASKPGLEKWRREQAILSALTHPLAGEIKDAEELMRVIEEDSAQQAKQAAARGTKIHAAVEAFYAGGDVPLELTESVSAIREAISGIHAPAQDWTPEVLATSDLGYGGRIDLVCDVGQGIVVDLKGQAFEHESDAKAWPEYALQLAAYREAIGRPQAQCWNVIFSRTHPDRVKAIRWGGDELTRGWRAFYALLEYHRIVNRL